MRHELPDDTRVITLDGVSVERALPDELSHPDALVDRLVQVSFLAAVPRELLRRLVGQVSLRRYAPGDVFIRQGEFGNSLFVLLDGEVTVHLAGEAGVMHEVARIGTAGSVIGEGGVLGRRRRTATVMAAGPALLVEIDKTRLERLDMAADGVVMSALEVQTELHVVHEFVRRHRLFAQMSLAGQSIVASHARLRIYERGQRVFARGEKADRVYIVKSGTAQFVRPDARDAPVMSYFSVGDAIGFALHQGSSAQAFHHYELVSRGYLELIEIEYARLLRLPERDRDLLRQFQKDAVERHPELPAEGANETVELFAGLMLIEGAQEGLSLLTIDLDTCIRCGNCVQACEERHGHARFTRQGEKLVRRVDGTDESRHQSVLIPASCRHCVNPECMIGCPTGAIHRNPGGEVVIEDHCIGCGSCATRCPWDNITMVPTPGRRVPGDDNPRDHIANKCDLCAGYDEPNCVHNCPTGAILRVEPTAFYPELRSLLGRTGQVAAERTVAARPRDRVRWVVPAIAAGLAVAAVGLRLLAGAAYRPWSPIGLLLGALTLGAMVGAVALAGRRRLAHRRRRTAWARRWGIATQGGTFRTWARVHVWLGGLALVFLLLHCDGRGGGAVTSALLLLTAVEVAAGVFGLVYGRWMPRVITRLEGSAQVEESVARERAQVEQRLSELSAAMGAVEWGLLDAVRRRAGGPWRRLASHAGLGFRGRLRGRGASAGRQAVEAAEGGRSTAPRDFEAQVEHARVALASGATELSAEARRVLRRLAADIVRLVDLRACERLYDIRRAWLGLHIALAALLAGLVVVHVVAVVAFPLLGVVRGVGP